MTNEQALEIRRLLERRNLGTLYGGALYWYTLTHLYTDGHEIFARFAERYGERKAIAYTLNEIQSNFHAKYIRRGDR